MVLPSRDGEGCQDSINVNKAVQRNYKLAKNTNEKQHIWHSNSGGLFTYIHDLAKGDRTMGIRPFSWGRFGTVPDAPEIECEGFGSNICEHCADYEECKKEYDEYIAENGENE